MDWYAPGFKAGGPIRSTVNLAEQLEDDMDVWVLTTDRDQGDREAYPGIAADTWTVRGKHRVFYASPSSLGWGAVLRVIRQVLPSVIYLNSMFSRPFTIYPLLMLKLGMIGCRVVLAPRGMLMVANLAQKPVRKSLYLRFIRWLGLPSRVRFHATDDTEVEDICRVMGLGVKPFLAGNMPGRQSPFIPCSEKQRGCVKMVFVGRMHPLKNLSYLLEVLRLVRDGGVELTVVASMEDLAYWDRCRAMIETLPERITVRLMEDVPHEQVEQILLSHHLFAYPTQGENFSHSIFGAFSAGRPALISDQTPWRNLSDAKAGWDLPLTDPGSFADKVREVRDMDLPTLNEWCLGAWTYARAYMTKSDLKKDYLSLFENV